MDAPVDYRISSLKQLREYIGTPHPLVPTKVWGKLEPTAVEYIAQSPLLFLATADAEGNIDVSPKGDAPGFVAVEDSSTLLIPDRKGNKLVFGMENIIANPRVGVIFVVPGTEETLRVNGRAELTADPVLLKRLTARNQSAVLVTRIAVEQCFFHCAKAFKRSQTWNPETWPATMRFSWGKILAPKTADDTVAQQIDKFVEEDYKNNL
jgi:PPOX class probable FMN-dependent enzyme